ncbi:hypothetical protein EVAR_87470_1 [Eumeta japonica]|uniref:Uncharacterized protein n=1 Tax=Eumeta variegata TaxID=151549 RepID=A0A4C1VXN6_EUMVA|nr:hypothetical protein EVAR_87470_1 [Eumeta japonica]
MGHVSEMEAHELLTPPRARKPWAPAVVNTMLTAVVNRLRPEQDRRGGLTTQSPRQKALQLMKVRKAAGYDRVSSEMPSEIPSTHTVQAAHGTPAGRTVTRRAAVCSHIAELAGVRKRRSIQTLTKILKHS